jgi:hypothetical protein
MDFVNGIEDLFSSDEMGLGSNPQLLHRRPNFFAVSDWKKDPQWPQ